MSPSPRPGRKAGHLSDRYRVDDGAGFKLKRVDPDDRAGLESEDRATDLIAHGVQRLSELQDMLYAQDRWALLVVIQAMDAAGKDGTIKHVFSGVNPQGCEVTPFKQPTPHELDHDWLWRTEIALPERGRIGIFNRSYYEEVLVVRVHPEILDAERIPPRLTKKGLWKERFKDIRAFERHLVRNGTQVRKFFLHVSKGEQRRRFLARLDEPDKNWKFALGDIAERDLWPDYMRAYEDMIRATATPEAPWYVVPADHKWFTRAVVSDALVAALEDLPLHYPRLTAARKRELAEARRRLEREG